MSHVSLIRRTIFLAMLPLTTASAQDALIEEEPEVRRYTVEMIIFKYAQEVGVGTETFTGEKLLPDEPLPIDGDIPMLSDGLAQPGIEPEAESDDDPVVLRDVEFVLLDKEDYTMDDIMRRLRRLDVYDPIMHFGWTQATWPEEETQSIELASLAAPPIDLNGSVKVYLSRFLHLVIDLELDAPVANAAPRRFDDSYASYGDIGELDRFGSVAPRTGPVRYRIEEDRIFRSGELRYFDHPKFGVLARVTRVEEDEADAGETELLGYPSE